MAKTQKKHKINLTEDVINAIFLVASSFLTILVIVLVAMAASAIQNQDLQQASICLFMIFVVLGISRLVIFFRERTKVTFLRFVVLLIFDIALGVIVLFAKDSPYLYSLCGGLYCLTIILSRLFRIVQNRTVRSIVINALIMALAALLAFGLFASMSFEDQYPLMVVLCIIIAISAVIEAISGATSKLKSRILFRIIVRTYALEIILGLVTVMIALSLVLWMNESIFPSFGDALWYSFAVVTTIGFGDFAAQTILGRIITVILGIYGIIVVAVITSIIVNFYNETSGKHDAEEFREIHNQNKKDK